MITTAYNKKAWVGEGCEVSKFADRGGGLSDGQIAVFINDPDAMLGGKVGDSELPARLAPRRVGELAGFPLYGRGDDAADTMVMMSSIVRAALGAGDDRGGARLARARDRRT